MFGLGREHVSKKPVVSVDAEDLVESEDGVMVTRSESVTKSSTEENAPQIRPLKNPDAPVGYGETEPDSAVDEEISTTGVESGSDIEDVDLSDPEQFKEYVADIEREHALAEKMGQVFAAVTDKDVAADVDSLLSAGSDTHSKLRIAYKKLSTLLEETDRDVDELNAAHDRFGDLYTELLDKYTQLRSKKPRLPNIFAEEEGVSEVIPGQIEDISEPEPQPETMSVDHMVAELRGLMEKRGDSKETIDKITAAVESELKRAPNAADRFAVIKANIENTTKTTASVEDTEASESKTEGAEEDVRGDSEEKLEGLDYSRAPKESIADAAEVIEPRADERVEDGVTDESLPGSLSDGMPPSEQMAYEAAKANWQEKRTRYKQFKQKRTEAWRKYYKEGGKVGKETDDLKQIENEYFALSSDYYASLKNRIEKRADAGIESGNTLLTESRLAAAGAEALVIAAAQERHDALRGILAERTEARYGAVLKRAKKVSGFLKKHKWKVRAAGLGVAVGAAVLAAPAAAGAAATQAVARKTMSIWGGAKLGAFGAGGAFATYDSLFTSGRRTQAERSEEEARVNFADPRAWAASEQLLFSAKQNLSISEKRRLYATVVGGAVGAYAGGTGAAESIDAGMTVTGFGPDIEYPPAAPNIEIPELVPEAMTEAPTEPQLEVIGSAPDFKPFSFEPQTDDARTAQSRLNMALESPETTDLPPGEIFKQTAERHNEPVPPGEAGPEQVAAVQQEMQAEITPPSVETYVIEDGISFPVAATEDGVHTILGTFDVQSVSVELSGDAAEVIDQTKVDTDIQQILMAKGETLSTLNEDELEAQVLSGLNALYTSTHPELENPVSSIELSGISYEPAVPEEVDVAEATTDPLLQEEITVTTLEDHASDEPIAADAGSETTEKEIELPDPELQYPPPQSGFDTNSTVDVSAVGATETSSTLGYERLPVTATRTWEGADLNPKGRADNFWDLAQGELNGVKVSTFEQFEGQEKERLIAAVLVHIAKHPELATELGFPNPDNLDLVYKDAEFKIGLLDKVAQEVAVEKGFFADQVTTDSLKAVTPPPPRPEELGTDVVRPIPRSEGLAAVGATNMEAATNAANVYTAAGGESLTDAIEVVYGEQLATLSEYQRAAALDRITEILTANPKILKVMDLNPEQFAELPEGSIDLTPLGILVMDEVHDRLGTVIAPTESYIIPGSELEALGDTTSDTGSVEAGATQTSGASEVELPENLMFELERSDIEHSYYGSIFGSFTFADAQRDMLGSDNKIWHLLNAKESRSNLFEQFEKQVAKEHPVINIDGTEFVGDSAKQLVELMGQIRALPNVQLSFDALGPNYSLTDVLEQLSQDEKIGFDQDTGLFINTATGKSLVSSYDQFKKQI